MRVCGNSHNESGKGKGSGGGANVTNEMRLGKSFVTKGCVQAVSGGKKSRKEPLMKEPDNKGRNSLLERKNTRGRTAYRG